MPTDEAREAFERPYKQVKQDYLLRFESEGRYENPDVRCEWRGFQDAWRARDAEVQALRERNGRLAHELFVLGVDIDAPNDEEGGAE